MRKELPAPGRLPFQIALQPVGLDRQQHQPVLALKVLGSGFRDLLGGGKMDIAVGHVDRRATGFPRAAQQGPFVGPEYLVDYHVPGDAPHPKRGQVHSQ